jgi:pectate lyase
MNTLWLCAAGWCGLGAMSVIAEAASPVPAFPGAEGFGRYAQGGRGGQVYVVNTLEDYSRREPPIAGSLRAACAATGPRTIVFAVSGTIRLKESLRITEPFLTIAGQTAPGDGVCLADHDVSIRDTHDVIVRYLRIRPGDVAQKELDALSVYRCQNVLIDHCSVSWSSDETLSVTGEGCTNVTVQWCFITESLNRSVHSKGEHGYGSLIRTDGDITYHHNLYAHHKTRCPRPGTYGADRGGYLEFVNNVIYDWASPAGYTAADKATIDYVGNYLKRGPSTKDRGRIFSVGGRATTMYVTGNVLEGDDAGLKDDWKWIDHAELATRSAVPVTNGTVRVEPATTAFDRILAEGGASRPRRDAVDERIVQEVRTPSGRIIDSQADVGGWPELRSTAPAADADRDGLPDAWERRHGLDPRSAADGPADADGDGYTNLEEFLNETDPRRAA